MVGVYSVHCAAASLRLLCEGKLGNLLSLGVILVLLLSCTCIQFELSPGP